MKKLLFILSILFLSILEINASPIDENTAKQVAQNFLKERIKSSNLKLGTVSLNLSYKVSPPKNTDAFKEEVPHTYYYVFNNESAEGFVIVAGDDNVLPILGYSLDGSFTQNNIPSNVAKWLEEYKAQIRDITENGIEATPQIANEWIHYSSTASNLISSTNETNGVSPLVQTKWSQSPYINALCPSNSVTGCVATAMAQIMKFWNFPATGSGFHSYNHDRYGTLSASFGSTTYQWGSMPNMVNSSNNAVATLMYHCGVSVDMNYSPESSNAYVISTQSPIQHCSEYALKTYFGYKNTLKGVERINYSQTQWVNLLKTELDAGRPILYAGFGSGGGHAFVCDGYDNSDYFHFNWGWGGAYDGYFSINALNPSGTGTGGGTGGYNNGHQAIIGIVPGSNNGGGGGTNPLDLRLYSAINMPSTSIWFRSPYSVSVDIGNWGIDNFSGQIGAAIFDANKRFVAFMETKNISLQSAKYQSYTFNNGGDAIYVPGIYYVSLYYKTSTKDWTVIADGSYSNLKQFKIEYTTDIETNSAYNFVTGNLIQGKPATINVDVLNTGSGTFYGKYRVNLSKLDGSWAQDIQVVNESSGLPYNYHYTGGLNFSGTITVEPGTYLLETAYQSNGSSSWYYAGSKNFQNPVYVTVKAPALLPDVYEVNNTISQSYTLPISFSGNSAAKNTVGSNIHIESDNDFYKINLPSGYKYIINARLHDAYKSGNGITYSVDAIFSYSTNSTTWSDTYDDVMPGNITIPNGGTVYFHVAPYFAGEVGTYLLDLSITRATNVGIKENTLANKIKIYPNPASEFIHIELDKVSEISTIDIFNMEGQQVFLSNIMNNDKVLKIPLQSLPNGVYFVRLISKEGSIQVEKILKT